MVVLRHRSRGRETLLSPRSLFFSALLLLATAHASPTSPQPTVAAGVALREAAATVVTTITETPTPTSTAQPADFTNDSTFQSAILSSTNGYREQHNASDVVWNSTLASFATAYLANNTGSDDCPPFAHSGGPYGENLAIGYANATASVDAWGDEGKKYDYNDPGFSEKTGHFTQLVWKDTTAVGCGRRLCTGGHGWYLVCEYWPRGNIIGEFKEEVDPSSGGTTLSVASWEVVSIMFGVWVGFWCLV
ncbi:PR-1-like protein [Xylariaceae sp. FL0255]|nr:PR-1-like protein [Xylariaceae sp. FL0255]